MGGATNAQVHEATDIDPWFLDQIELINEIADEVGSAPELTEELLRYAKRHGFSDVQLASLRATDGDPVKEADIRALRKRLGVEPVYKTVDTCAAEFEASTPYHYSTYDEETEVAPRDKQHGLDSRFGAKPHRPGHRVRLLVRACGLGFA